MNWSVKMLKSKENRLILLVLVVLVFGIIMVYSASWPYAVDIGNAPEFFAKKQIIAAVIALVVMGITSFLPYTVYKKLSIPIYLISYLLCLLLFTPLGDNYGTFARRWLNLGISFMPSDIHKIAAIIIMASYLSARRKDLPVLKDFLPVMGLIAVTILPIYLQPNLSTVVLIIAVMGGIYFMSGMKLSYFLAIIPAGLLSVYVFFSGPSNEYRRQRVSAVFNPLEDYLGTGWQLSQALFAVSSGGLLGLGLGRSRQKHLYLSEAHNDFIFAIIAEELGLIGCAFVIVAFLIFIKLGFGIAARAKDEFGQLLAVGITLMIGFQAFINMGVALGVLPPTGLVLPFISYGGTSLVINLAMIGILINISRKNR